MVSAIIGIALVGGTALPVHAEEEFTIPSDILAELNAKFDELGVDPTKREGLLEKYADGEAFDSSSGIDPVSTDDYRMGITDYVREVFPDGSVSLTSIERPARPEKPGEVTTYGLSGCNTYSVAALLHSQTARLRRLASR